MLSYSSSANDYRSDTFTLPTKDIWDQVYSASVGDSTYQEDDDTNQLQERIVKEFTDGHMYGGAEAASLFCVSTTMANQLALRALFCQTPPYSLVCDKNSHIYVYECGGVAALSHALTNTIQPSNGKYLTLEDIQNDYFPDIGDIHDAPTKVIALENAIHGICHPLEELERISKWAHSKGISLHLDGARLWNAAAVQDDPIAYMRNVISLFDTVTLCLSKSIGAPIGSILIGSSKAIQIARHLQKQQGGGLRQAGFITNIANYCITKNFPDTIRSVCEATRAFWERLHSTLKKNYDMELVLSHPVEINFIFIDLKSSGISLDTLLEFAEKHDIKLFDGRLAFHHQNIDTSSLDKLMETFVDLAKYYAKSLKASNLP